MTVLEWIAREAGTTMAHRRMIDDRTFSIHVTRADARTWILATHIEASLIKWTIRILYAFRPATHIRIAVVIFHANTRPNTIPLIT